MKSTEPQHNASNFYYRNNIIIGFTESAPSATLSLLDEHGDEVDGQVLFVPNQTRMTFDPHGNDTYLHLLPNTTYTALINWERPETDEPVELVFTTSAVGTNIEDPVDTVVGNHYFVNVGMGKFHEPPGVGGLLAQYAEDMSLLFKVRDVHEDSGGIEILGATTVIDGEEISQDLCEPTMNLTEPGTGHWDNPYLETVPRLLQTKVEGKLVTIHDFKYGASITEDGEMAVGGMFDGVMDIRVFDTLIDPHAQEGAACELLASLGLLCGDCPDDTGRFCMYVAAYDIPGTRVDVYSMNPETGEEYDTIIEISQEMVDHWIELD